MSDLTYCYIHMTRKELQVLDTYETPDYLKGDLSDDELDIPSHMVPPNPDESDILPSQIHPSYPYGNPTSVKHPSARPRPPYDPTSRALFEDIGYTGAGVNGALRWKDLALDLLLPPDEELERSTRAAEARKMASGAANNPQQQHEPEPQGNQTQIQEQSGDEGDGEEDGDEEDGEGSD